MISSLSPHSLHLQFCCVLSILFLIWLVLTALFCAAIHLRVLLISVSRWVFFWNLSDSKFPQVDRTFLSILADFNNAVVWMVSTPPLISKCSLRRCPWCNCYRRRKRTRRHEFKSWTKLIAFHIALIPLGKVWFQLFSLQLWVNSRAD